MRPKCPKCNTDLEDSGQCHNCGWPDSDDVDLRRQLAEAQEKNARTLRTCGEVAIQRDDLRKEAGRLRAEWADTDECEHCQACGRHYLTAWEAPDELWRRIVGKGGAGLLCPMCFDRLCRERGILLHWQADEAAAGRASA